MAHVYINTYVYIHCVNTCVCVCTYLRALTVNRATLRCILAALISFQLAQYNNNDNNNQKKLFYILFCAIFIYLRHAFCFASLCPVLELLSCCLFAFLLWPANYFCLLFTFVSPATAAGGWGGLVAVPGCFSALSALISRPSRRQYLLCTRTTQCDWEGAGERAVPETKANGKARYPVLSARARPTPIKRMLPAAQTQPRHFAVLAQWC